MKNRGIQARRAFEREVAIIHAERDRERTAPEPKTELIKLLAECADEFLHLRSEIGMADTRRDHLLSLELRTHAVLKLVDREAE